MLKMVKKTFIFLDRDGTLIYDNKYYLGSQRNWKSLVSICSRVVDGIKKLRKIPNVKLFMITNQVGVGIKEKPLLTVKRANEVCRYVMKRFKEKGAKLDGYDICVHPSPAYVKRKKGIFTFNKKLVCDCDCIKPKPGMINRILKKYKVKRKDVNIYMIGDRASDVLTGLNAKGFGILVPFNNEKITSKDRKEIQSKKNVYIAKSFIDAVDFILKQSNVKNSQ